MHFINLLQQWWQQQSWLEITGVITGLLCVYLAAVNNIWNWPIAIISTVIYIYIFAKTALYADMLQYSYLTILNVYGWYYWSRKDNRAKKVPVRPVTKKNLLVSFIIILTVSPLLGFLLINFAAKLHYQPPAFPYIDSFCTVCSLLAQFFMARKVLENWLMWIFVDIIYVVVYLLKGLQITAGMFAVYIIIALLGYIDWRKTLQSQRSGSLN